MSPDTVPSTTVPLAAAIGMSCSMPSTASARLKISADMMERREVVLAGLEPIADLAHALLQGSDDCRWVLPGCLRRGNPGDHLFFPHLDELLGNVVHHDSSQDRLTYKAFLYIFAARSMRRKVVGVFARASRA